jgi:fructose-1,6-bisphosphatase
MNKANQTSDAANAGKSGGVNFQGGTVKSADVLKSDRLDGAGNVPAKGTSNGGK